MTTPFYQIDFSQFPNWKLTWVLQKGNYFRERFIHSFNSVVEINEANCGLWLRHRSTPDELRCERLVCEAWLYCGRRRRQRPINDSRRPTICRRWRNATVRHLETGEFERLGGRIKSRWADEYNSKYTKVFNWTVIVSTRRREVRSGTGFRMRNSWVA